MWTRRSGLSENAARHRRSFAPKGVIQEYVQDLLLIDSRKFAVRVYLLVARVAPLLVLLHSSGYAKVCGMEYDAASFSQQDLFRHVTNQEFQKKGGQVRDDWEVRPPMTLEEVDAQLLAQGRPEPRWSVSFWKQARQICMEVVGCFREQVTKRGRLGSFEVLGLDFVCRADGQLVFLEANRDPSWVVDGHAKQGVIPALISDMLEIVLRAHGDNPQARSHAADSVGAGRAAGLHGFEVLVDEEHRIGSI
eukprot:gnl/TRDRNA2_/TRDRNA2_167719_c0_seq2.p1 gnl/TRDRNA2_/TRDRNA2_167719_c0~~gnl/TRDRNA2_/TRDRNA2_167719_c0_seq2.p1  ORF type:complete len:249 (+),score=48.99 gnl/TRDRNA2_/TRDRNA2_167719_c0_seq2:310-1056(+)